MRDRNVPPDLDLRLRFVPVPVPRAPDHAPRGTVDHREATAARKRLIEERSEQTGVRTLERGLAPDQRVVGGIVESVVVVRVERAQCEERSLERGLKVE